MRSSRTDEIRLASNWTVRRVKEAINQGRSNDLVRFLRARHKERFFRPIKLMMEADGNGQGYGFSIMALCSLLVETLESYWQGLPSTYERELQELERRHAPVECRVPKNEWKHGRVIFQSFFKRNDSVFKAVDGDEFYRNIRNGLLHQAQTKGGWKINKSQPSTWDTANKSVNRDRFARCLKQAFESYLAQLKKEGWNSDVWKKARRKIWWLIELSK
jgi:hypothetical protein